MTAVKIQKYHYLASFAFFSAYPKSWPQLNLLNQLLYVYLFHRHGSRWWVYIIQQGSHFVLHHQYLSLCVSLFSKVQPFDFCHFISWAPIFICVLLTTGPPFKKRHPWKYTKLIASLCKYKWTLVGFSYL